MNQPTDPTAALARAEEAERLEREQLQVGDDCECRGCKLARAVRLLASDVRSLAAENKRMREALEAIRAYECYEGPWTDEEIIEDIIGHVTDILDDPAALGGRG